MRPLPIEDIRSAVGGRWIAPARGATVLRATTDSRDTRPGDLFVALRGPNFDGHAFLSAAASGGCVAAVVDRTVDLPPAVAGSFAGGIIGVEETTRALGDLAAWHRRGMSTRVIAVTGSNGKTTVKEMIHAVLSSRWTGSRNVKSFNNSIGLPMTLLGANEGDDYVVCEIGTNAPGEVAALAQIAAPDVAVITSVAEAHLAGLGSIENVAAEKASILASLADDGTAVIFADSEPLARAVAHYDVNVIRFGASTEADVRLTGYEPHGRRSRFEVDSRLWVDLPLAGRHNAMNALSALAVGGLLGMDRGEAADALARTSTVSMRTQWIDAGAVTIINDAYNANPASVRAGADVLAAAPGRRRVMIVGDMCELGPRSEQLHEQLGAELAGCGFDLLIGVGRLGRYIARGASGGERPVAAFDSPDQAAMHLKELLREGDVILIKGSRATGMEVLVEPIRSAFAGGRECDR